MKFIQIEANFFINKEQIKSFKLFDSNGYGNRCDRIIIYTTDGHYYDFEENGHQIMEKILSD